MVYPGDYFLIPPCWPSLTGHPLGPLFGELSPLVSDRVTPVKPGYLRSTEDDLVFSI